MVLVVVRTVSNYFFNVKSFFQFKDVVINEVNQVCKCYIMLQNEKYFYIISVVNIKKLYNSRLAIVFFK